MKRHRLFKKQMVIAAFALSLITTAFAPTQTVEAAAKKPAQVKTVNVKAVNSTKAKISWKKAKNAKTYQVNIATDKKFKKNKKAYSTKAVSKTVSKLKAGRKYYVRIRAKGKSYGKWSSVKSFTLKAKKINTKKPSTSSKPTNPADNNSKPTNPADNNSKPINSQPTGPAKPVSCKHSWKYDVNLDSMANHQRDITGCGVDITNIRNEIYANNPKSAIVNGKSFTWTISNFGDMGIELYGPEYDTPCIVCHKYCGPIWLKTTDNLDDLGVTDHTKRTCTKCGKVEISGKDFTNGEVTYE